MINYFPYQRCFETNVVGIYSLLLVFSDNTSPNNDSFLVGTAMTHINISQIMFKVKGCYDAILYFLSRDRLYSYKIGIENGNGTFSKITKFSTATSERIGKIVQIDTSKEDLMACNEYRFLWIRWSDG